MKTSDTLCVLVAPLLELVPVNPLTLSLFVMMHSISSHHTSGPGGGSFIGSGKLIALQADNLADVDYLYWYFNYVFAGTTATIVSGAVAERCQFRAYLVYSFALAGFIYPVCSHWIWDTNGFLNGKVYDFAGGGGECSRNPWS